MKPRESQVSPGRISQRFRNRRVFPDTILADFKGKVKDFSWDVRCLVFIPVMAPDGIELELVDVADVVVLLVVELVFDVVVVVVAFDVVVVVVFDVVVVVVVVPASKHELSTDRIN